MSYNLNYYLAHRALTMNDFFGAAHYYFRSLNADPLASLTAINFALALRFVARALGMKRSAMPFQPKPISFSDFQPKPELEARSSNLLFR